MTDSTRTSAVESFGRIDPERSACVLIGVDDYSRLDPLRSVRLNLKELRAALTDPDIWGIPDDERKRIRTVANPASPAELVGPIREAAALAEDTLIVYYAGHGLIDRHERQLLLTLPDSVEDQPDTCVRSGDVRRAIRDTGSALRRVLILDCCFSGHVLTEMTDGHGQDVQVAVSTLRDVEGAYVMTSAPRDRPSHAPDPKRCTLFTGALVDVMRQGLPDGPEMLGLRDLFLEARRRIHALKPEVPQEPQDEDHNGVGGLDFVHNAAKEPRWPPQVPPPPPTRWQRLRTPVLSVTAGALGVALGLGIPPLVHWWHDTHPAAAAGPCAAPSADDPAAPRAVLLDHSDALNKQNVKYEDIYGLSALALVSQGKEVEALALADNAPGRVWPVTLGSPFKLALRAGTAVPLRRADGTKFPIDGDWYDGEGMVIEEGGKTMLISSETGPAIRRFDIATGHQVGKDFPIPKKLRYAPGGSAQTGRSIESLAVTPDGRHLYAGWEGPLADDGDTRGRGIIRIQRYTGTPGGAYTPDGQYAFLAEDGMYLSELTAIDDNGDLLALERQYTAGLGSEIRIAQLSLTHAQDVTKLNSLWHQSAKIFATDELVVDMATCPAGGPGAVAVPASTPQHPLLDNVEGMALGAPWKSGTYKGWHPLYLVSDDNDSETQITRFYSLAVKLRS
ncbi:esterase-like activity of phytase family protein [Streptomyces sp. NPDC048385]|uniref:caspase, EACC1-associated type n=1 Tax=Streptomyces sp. NPDC048385 TaxID=3155145 RepID=UPI003432FA5E